MEGRDIATRITPEANVKFYLYADFETRVERLYNQNPMVDIKKIRRNLSIRDELDITGENFIKPKDAVEIDTTNKSIDEVFQIMMQEINKII